MKKTVLATVALAAAVFSLASCGGKSESKSATSSSASSSAAEFIFNNGTEPQSLDPSKIQGVPEHRLYMALFEGLVSYDAKTNEAVPGVAESWSLSEDVTVLTFKLRNTTWSDGTPITAQTFVDSWLYYLAPETAAEYAYMPAAVIKGAEAYNAGKAGKETVGLRAVDDTTFEVTLVGPVPYAISMMAHYSFAPLPLHAMEKFGNDWTKPGNFVGNGPFVLSEWLPQDHISVVPNDKYWNKANVFLSKVTFLTIENETTGYNKYKNGELDWDTTVPLEMLDEIKLTNDYHVSPQISSYYYELNFNNPILADVRVRKALAKSINTQELVDKVTKGGQIPATSFCPPMSGFTPATGNAYDVETAKALLAEAGYPNGAGFPKMTVIYNTNEGHKKIAEYVQQEWKKNLGIDVELSNMEWGTFLEERQHNNFEIARAGWVGDYMDPSNFLELLLSTSGNNDGRYNNPKYDELIKKAATMPAGAERMQVLHDAEELMMTEEQALIPFYYYVSQNMIDLDKWDGWYTNPLDVHPWVGIKPKR